MSNQEQVFDSVGESPKYLRSKRRRFQRQRSKALAKIPVLNRTNPAAKDVNMTRLRKRSHVSECTSEEGAANPDQWVKVPGKDDDFSQKTTVHHSTPGRQLSLPPKMFPSHVLTPAKRPLISDRPLVTQSWTSTKIGSFEYGQASYWKYGITSRSHQQWKTNHFINSSNQTIVSTQWHARWSFQSPATNLNLQGNSLPTPDRNSRNPNIRPLLEPRYGSNITPTFRPDINNK